LAELTFIILARGQGQDSASLDDLLQSSPMAGDVNLFLTEKHEEEKGLDASPFDAELEVMIAGKQSELKRGI
jgi:hypothetical protein